ncbi:MAG: hypothetical protein IJ310_03055 [Clostridia bacterium]|nr:hypothetical protein [Clostridia bacterium]
MELRNTKPTTTSKPTPKKKTDSNIHKDHRSRLKNQFISNGIDALTDIQKLELLLFYSIPQKDTNPIAHKLLAEFGSLKNILAANVSDLMKVSGIKENSATLIKFVGSMLNYCSRPDEEDVIDSTSKGKDFASKYFAHIEVEQFYVFCLTKSNKLKKSVLINSGTAGEVNVQIRNITQVAIENKCDRIIVSHNHPCGKAIMSDQDCKFTYSLICSCILNNIDVLDHIIVGTDRTISLYEQGIIEKLKMKAANTIQLSEEKRFFISESSKSYIKSNTDE